MNDSYLIHNRFGETLYREIKKLPICDYHCHLSPREIFEDQPFSDISDLWLSGDHYKWRLMRSCGVSEDQITGNADPAEKFSAYASCIELGAGSPLYHWTKMELDHFFQITDPLTAENADRIRSAANSVIVRKQLSPRQLILDSNVRLVATTDDLCDDLFWHEKIAADPSFPVRVIPTFRTDRLLMINAPDYRAYLQRLSEISRNGVPIQTLDDLENAVCTRLDFFVAHGCRMTDVGIPLFPPVLRDIDAAQAALSGVQNGEDVSELQMVAFVDHMMRFLAIQYAKRKLIMQLHIAVSRNVNSKLYSVCGKDAGGDCIGDSIPSSALATFLDAIHTDSPCGLPQTILYCLHPAMIPSAASVIGCFPNIRLGPAWWFCDHKRGIREQLETVAEYGSLANFPGMLTDSRSFLSYARHDYFRRILCDLLGEWVESDELTADAARKIASALCYSNSVKLLYPDNESLSENNSSSNADIMYRATL